MESLILKWFIQYFNNKYFLKHKMPEIQETYHAGETELGENNPGLLTAVLTLSF